MRLVRPKRPSKSIWRFFRAVGHPATVWRCGCVAALLTFYPSTAPHAQTFEAVPIGKFAYPVHVAVAPGYPRLLFVVEKPGSISILRDEQRLDATFLDIRDLVRGRPDEGASIEDGLLSIAFPPDYAASGRFYVAFTNNAGNLEIDEFRRSAGNAVVADPTTRRTVLTIRHPTGIHNGGQLQFGPDGLLYVSVGDAANGDAARRLDSLLGKILRINPLPLGSQPYTVPLTNPFVGTPGRDEIFAYGLRNAWRFSFDAGRIAIADVGQDLREEVNFLSSEDAAGANFGWPQYEGELAYDATRPGAHAPRFPILTYNHSRTACAIIGGHVVRDRNLPSLMGRYVYGDSCNGEIRSFFPRVSTQEAVDDRAIGLALPGVTGFGIGSDGQIYLARSTGQLSRLGTPALEAGQPQIVLHVTGTSYRQPPIGQVLVDGETIGYFAVVSAVSNQYRPATEADIGAAVTALGFSLDSEACPQEVEVRFLNDEFAGDDRTGDTNLLLKSIEVNGKKYSGQELVADSTSGEVRPEYAVLWRNGSIHLHLAGGACRDDADKAARP
jgi:glucose/arabinose dehydrogenase